eukprot:CAMPEP_0194371048 /NCGR_PEP_ID=MMETSP0174-20130528/19402_1 /TAXON_ID=216777 /ORGANISM="Proboscia alata, Strain PI-D3" /LENGTH=729 /DNA_ID=CAMNT_0039148863 /DNA_START=185 /DNA_END=2370 /DNA_ORIENTATION=+
MTRCGFFSTRIGVAIMLMMIISSSGKSEEQHHNREQLFLRQKLSQSQLVQRHLHQLGSADDYDTDSNDEMLPSKKAIQRKNRETNNSNDAAAAREISEQEGDFSSSGSAVKITVAERPTVTKTAAAADRSGAQQVRQETTLQLKYVTGKMSPDSSAYTLFLERIELFLTEQFGSIGNTHPFGAIDHFRVELLEQTLGEKSDKYNTDQQGGATKPNSYSYSISGIYNNKPPPNANEPYGPDTDCPFHIKYCTKVFVHNPVRSGPDFDGTTSDPPSGVMRGTNNGLNRGRHLNGENNNYDADNLMPIHLRLSIVGEYMPSDDLQYVKTADFGTVINSLFTKKGYQLTNELGELYDNMGVGYFQYITDIQAVHPDDVFEKEDGNTSHSMKKVFAFMGILVGIAGLVMMSVGLVRKVSQLRNDRIQDNGPHFAKVYVDDDPEETDSTYEDNFDYSNTRPSKRAVQSKSYETSTFENYYDEEETHVVERNKTHFPNHQEHARTMKKEPHQERARTSTRESRIPYESSSTRKSEENVRKPSRHHESANLEELIDVPKIGTDEEEESVIYSVSDVPLYDPKKEVNTNSNQNPFNDDDTATQSSSSYSSVSIPTDNAIRRPMKMKSTTSSSNPSSRRQRKYPIAPIDGTPLECFTPAGKVGVAIDTAPDEGGTGPIVHKVSAGSPLEGILNPGDRILAIDDQDCRGLSAANVTRLMVKRMDKKRKITYIPATYNDGS